MNEDLRTITALLRDLISSYINNPKRLLLNATEIDGAFYIEMKATADDQPKVVGKLGAHIKALRVLLKEVGLGIDRTIAFTLLEPYPGTRGEPERPKPVSEYDQKQAHELLERVVALLVLKQARVDCARIPGDRPCSYLFTITPHDAADYADLITPQDDEDPEKQTVIGALGTLYRAFANKDGVQFKIEVKQP